MSVSRETVMIFHLSRSLVSMEYYYNGISRYTHLKFRKEKRKRMNAYKTLQTRVQSQVKLLKANEKSIEKARLQMQCACVHRDGNGAISLNSPQGGGDGNKSRITGAPLYTCRECHKKLDLSQIKQEDFDLALDVLDRICDISKIRLDCKTDRDRDLLNDIATFQYQLNDLMRNLYNSAVKGGNKKKNKSRGEDNSVRISR